jgi:YebC/PmpR family DNA-binding regulatory protein
MSGHSHAKTIKHKKDLADQQRGKTFSKLSRLISIAAREGVNPDENSKLREAINKAKEANMPALNVERAIKRGSGEMEGEKLEEVVFEACGPGNIAIIIEGITDNKNRTVSEIKQTFNQHNGKLVGENSLKWMFERKGIINLRITNGYEYTNNKKEELELKVIEAGAEDIIWRKDALEVYTSIDGLEKVKEKLQEQRIEIESSTLGWKPKKEIELLEKEKQAVEKLFEALDENDAVQEIYSNLKI